MMDLKVNLLLAVLSVLSIEEVIGDTKFDVNKELGYFSKCKGKQVNYPSNLVAEGALHVFECQTSLDYIRASNKYCVGVCVMQKYGYLFANMTYNYDVAIQPLLDGVKDQTMDKEVVDIQTAALKRCNGHGRPYSLDDDCEEAKASDDCIRTAQATECASPGD